MTPFQKNQISLTISDLVANLRSKHLKLIDIEMKGDSSGLISAMRRYSVAKARLEGFIDALVIMDVRIVLEHEIVEGDSVVKSWSFYEGGKEATL